MKIKKYLAFLLVIALAVIPLFVTGCAPGDDPNDVTTKEGILPPSFGSEQKNFEGARFVVLTREDRSKGQAFNIVDLVANEELGDSAVVSAVVTRNETLKSYYNVNIERVTVTDALAEARSALMKRDDSYSSYMLSVQQGLELALNGTLVDFYNDVSYIDLEADWWDSAIINNLLLVGGAYVALGDINTVDDDCTWVVLFNKKLYEEETHNQSKVLYDMVLAGDGQSGGWTIENFKSIASTSYRADPNVDNKYEPDYAGTGTYSVYLEDKIATALLVSSGNTPTVLDSTTYIGIKDNIKGNSEFYDAFETVYDFMGGSDKSQWLCNINDITTTTTGDIWETIARGGFKSDRVMFYMCHVGTIGLVRDMETEFGVLPLPKLSTQQQDYGNTIQYDNATCYVVPSFSDMDPDADENAAYILEAMAYMSGSEYAKSVDPNNDISLKYAYRETVLKRRATRDDESMAMLDLIFDNRIFDLACAMNVNGLVSVIQNNATSSSAHNFESSYNALPDITATMADKLKVLIGN